MRIFVSGTGTGVGKTWLTTALARRLTAKGRLVAALKPLETGCDPAPLDALALASACGHPELADYPGFYRARLPLAPAAATASGEPPPPALAALVERIEAASRSIAADDLIVEGAGGLLVPLDARHDLVDLPLALELPVLLVGLDALGTLSHTRAAVEAAVSRGVTVRAIALTQPRPEPDLSAATNADLLASRTGIPVFRFAHRPTGPAPEELDPLVARLAY